MPSRSARLISHGQKVEPDHYNQLLGNQKREGWVRPASYNIRGLCDFGEIGGFGLPEGIVKGMFFGLCAEIFDITNCATP
jgi:hypothetical protein